MIGEGAQEVVVAGFARGGELEYLMVWQLRGDNDLVAVRQEPHRLDQSSSRKSRLRDRLME